MGKRILAVLLAVVLVAGALPMTAGAVDYSYKAWSQGDSRWGSMSLSPSGYGHSMTWEGCYVTAVAKLLVHAGQQDPSNFTPKECLQGLLEHGMLSADGGIYYGSFNNGFLPAYGPQLYKENSDAHGKDPWDKGRAINIVSGKIRDGYYVIVCVNNKESGNTHYMTVDYVSDDIYVMDNGGVIPLYGTWKYSGGVIDQVYFKYSGPYAYPAYKTIHEDNDTKPDTTVSGGTTKTQYRYHRYEDPVSHDYFVCAKLGLSYYSSMKLVYTDWMDSPLPAVSSDYLVHPYQGASCANAGCLSSDPYQTYRYRDSAGKVWYYQETRTVTVADTTPTPTPEPPTPDSVPNCDKGHTWSGWQVIDEATCEDAGQREHTCSVCGEAETQTVAALGHKYQVKQETDTSVLYVCANCGDSYLEEKEPAAVDNSGMVNFTAKNRYSDGLFWDVKSGDWFSGNVATAYSMGLMNGTGSGSFSPGNNMTLAEAVTLAARIHSLYYQGKESFATYDGGNWYDPYVDYARDNGIIYENYNFGRPATREEVVHILARALPEDELENTVGRVSFADSGEITYMADVRLLSGAGVINGIQENGSTHFKPLDPITRAEVAAIVGRMVQPSQRVGK